jgi:hypothetical protein
MCVRGQTIDQQRTLHSNDGTQYFLIHTSEKYYPLAAKAGKCDHKDETEDHWHEGPGADDHSDRA